MKPLLLVLGVIRNVETRSLVKTILEEAGHRLVQPASCEQAIALLNNGLCPDLVIVETQAAGFPDADHLYLEMIKSASEHAVCLVMGLADQLLSTETETAVSQYVLRKPVTRQDFELMLEQLGLYSDGNSYGEFTARCKESAGTVTKNSSDMPAMPLVEELGEGRYFLAASPAMLKIHRQVQLLADVDAPVLILGESGTGKEVIAHLIHKNSRRSLHKFLNVNCAALPADLLESELFGYQQGAFTGAVKDKPGKFEQVNRGTLLLDEIGEMSAQMQAKLLHVLQDGQFTRLGARESSRVDVRVLAATNVPIESALEERTFREDLYYRLNVFTIQVPPLRERREEIPYLIEETIRRTPVEMKNGGDFNFSSRLMDATLLCDWRGNVRELRNFVTRTIIMRDTETAVRELETKIAAGNEASQDEESIHIQSQADGLGMRSIMRDVRDRTEAQLIQNALEISGWNRRHAAKFLNISYRGLLYKIQQHRLAPKPPVDVGEALGPRFSARGNVS